MKRVHVVAAVSSLALAVGLIGPVALAQETPSRGVAAAAPVAVAPAAAPSIGSGPLACLFQSRVDCRDVVHLKPFRFDGSLVKANLARIHLRGADLSGATLRRANLKGAILRGVNLSGADLRKANFGPAKAARSNGPVVRSTAACAPNCQFANLMYADLSGADLRGANLYGAILVGTNLSGANLAGADLESVLAYDADMTGANLEGADLKNSEFTGSVMVGASMAGASITRADLSFVDLTDADMSSADLTKTCLYGAEAVRTNLTGANVSYTSFEWAWMIDAYWTNVVPNHTNLAYAELSNTNDWDTVPLDGIEFNDTCDG